VLIAKDDAYIFDFEGEAGRPLEERRRKQPAARDVAGFIRSIDYATNAALDRAPNLTPEQRVALAPRIRAWGERLAAAFLHSYRETLAPAALWPAKDGRAHALLDLFLLEKALSEIEHELTARLPSAHIPIEASLRILARCGAIGS
jgi:maltose alpha-D-glucosyltransferase/alpha-amylase